MLSDSYIHDGEQTKLGIPGLKCEWWKKPEETW